MTLVTLFEFATFNRQVRDIPLSQKQEIKKEIRRGVTSKTVSSQATVKDISKTNAAQSVVRNKLLSLLDPKDPNSVTKVVRVIQSDEALSLNCHDIGHDIGHKAYELYGFTLAMNFTESKQRADTSVQDICAGGYVHGILEEAALRTPHFEDAPGSLCVDIPAKRKDSCFHGVGHALMFVYDRNVEKSLISCRLIGSVSYTSRCFEGVFMELFWGEQEATTEKELGFSFENPLTLCQIIGDDAKPACFIYSALGYLRFHKKDYRGAIKECTKKEMVGHDSEYCLKGVGIAMNKNFKSKNLESVEDYVNNLTFYQRYAFYQGVLGYAVFSGVPKSDLKETCKLFKNDMNMCINVLDEY